MTADHRNHQKKIYLSINNEGLSLFLTTLLSEWGFSVNGTCPDDPNDLLLTEENSSPCTSHRKRVNLTYSPYIDSDHVNIPIVLEQLWKVLEKHYHRPPRHHLRLAVDYPIAMTIRGIDSTARLNSLSPAGARLSLPRELAVGELFPISLPLKEEILHLSARVIYVTTFPDSDNRYDTGILFERITSKEKALLHDDILLTFLNRIRPHLPRWAFEVGINQCELSPALRKQL